MDYQPSKHYEDNIDRVEKLPKWAQQIVSELQRAVEGQQSQIEHLRGQTPEGATGAVVLADRSDEVVVSDHARLRVYVGEDKFQYIEIGRTPESNSHQQPVTIRSGDGALLVQPSVSNSITVGITDR